MKQIFLMLFVSFMSVVNAEAQTFASVYNLKQTSDKYQAVLSDGATVDIGAALFVKMKDDANYKSSLRYVSFGNARFWATTSEILDEEVVIDTVVPQDNGCWTVYFQNKVQYVTQNPNWVTSTKGRKVRHIKVDATHYVFERYFADVDADPNAKPAVTQANASVVNAVPVATPVVAAPAVTTPVATTTKVVPAQVVSTPTSVSTTNGKTFRIVGIKTK